MTVREFLSDPKRWTKAAYARDANGRPVRSGDKTAMCFCLNGAINQCFVGDPQGNQAAWDKVFAVVMAKGDPAITSVCGFNDHPDTKHKDILAVLDEAGV